MQFTRASAIVSLALASAACGARREIIPIGTSEGWCYQMHWGSEGPGHSATLWLTLDSVPTSIMTREVGWGDHYTAWLNVADTKEQYFGVWGSAVIGFYAWFPGARTPLWSLDIPSLRDSVLTGFGVVELQDSTPNVVNLGDPFPVQLRYAAVRSKCAV